MKFAKPSAALCALTIGSSAIYATEPLPEVPSISIYADYEANLRSPGNIIRKAGYDWRRFEDIAKAEYPVDAVAAKKTARAKIKVGVGGDDAIVYCIPVSVEKDEPLGAGACDLIRKYGKFTHALDANGTPTQSEIGMIVYWDIRPAIFAPPAPPPPPRWLETPDGGRLDMLAASFSPPRAEMTKAPDWKAFAVTDKKAPKKTKAVAKITLDSGNKAEKCDIIGSSGYPGIDAASCNALLTANYRSLTAPYPNYKPTLALMVEWTGNKAKPLTALQKQVMPNAAPMTFTADQFPAGFTMPKWGNNLQVSIDPSGKMTRCLVTSTTNNDAADAAMCGIVRRQGRFTGAKDIFGRSAYGGLVLTVEWSTLTIRPPYDAYNR